MFRVFKYLLAPSRRRYRHLNPMVKEGSINPIAKPLVLDRSVCYLVSVPIGNVKDFTLRALEVLRSVDYIVCVHRVATRILLNLIDIPHEGRLIQYDRSAKRQDRLVKLIKGGASIAFVPIQGTAGIGDDGAPSLVQFLQSNGVRVSGVPGPDACTTALTMSGAMALKSPSHDPSSFYFGGMLGARRGPKLIQIKQQMLPSLSPTVWFDAPHRVSETLRLISEIEPSRRVTLIHEATKAHEAIHADAAKKLDAFYRRSTMEVALRKGQVTLVVDPSHKSEESLRIRQNYSEEEMNQNPFDKTSNIDQHWMDWLVQEAVKNRIKETKEDAKTAYQHLHDTYLNTIAHHSNTDEFKPVHSGNVFGSQYSWSQQRLNRLQAAATAVTTTDQNIRRTSANNVKENQLPASHFPDDWVPDDLQQKASQDLTKKTLGKSKKAKAKRRFKKLSNRRAKFKLEQERHQIKLTTLSLLERS